MRVSQLSLTQFRSFRDFTIDLGDAQVHTFVGPNGAGKTNILESLSILSLTKSFLSSEEIDMVRWGDEFYRVRAEVIDATGTNQSLEVVSQIAPRKQKACFVNDVRTPITGVIGRLPTVTFLPQDLLLFSGMPGLRRAFLDRLLCQVSPEYVEASAQYSKILKQRNTLLKRIAEGVGSEKDLISWDHMLAQQGATIVVKRLELLEVLQCTLLDELTSLAETWKKTSLYYQRKGEAHDFDDVRNELVSLLEHYRDRDRILQSTTIGPHRDDWQLLVDGRSVETFASRGQQRTAVLALLLLKVSFLELRRGEKPIILLDDVFSELDDAHQHALLDSLQSYQTFITTTHLPPKTGSNVRVWDVAQSEEVTQLALRK